MHTKQYNSVLLTNSYDYKDISKLHETIQVEDNARDTLHHKEHV